MNKYYHIPAGNINSPIFQKGSLGEIVKSYQRCFSVKNFSRGPFKFYGLGHDTGFGVEVFLNIEGLPERNIIRSQYWYAGGYQFNTSHFESGTWDRLLEETIDQIQQDTIKEFARRESLANSQRVMEDKSAQEAKAQYEKFFT